MVPAQKPCTAVWISLAFLVLFFGNSAGKEIQSPSPTKPRPSRSFRTFLPKPGETIDDPGSQVVQILLDRQDKGEFDSYMVQVLFRGIPSERSYRILADRVEIDFYDTGKPSMRLAKIRGGAVEASSLDELFYKDNAAKAGAASTGTGRTESGRTKSGRNHIKRMVRLTLFMQEKAELKFRDTLDRTLIHFRLPKESGFKD